MYLINLILMYIWPGTKEREFVNALSAAALTYTIARGCASSSTFNCSCSPHPGDPPNGNFKWGGCGDNVQWGSKFSRRFIDTHRKHSEKFRNSKYYDFTNTDVNEDDDHDDINYNKNLSYYIRRHNNEIGRKVSAQARNILLVNFFVCIKIRNNNN